MTNLTRQPDPARAPAAGPAAAGPAAAGPAAGPVAAARSGPAPGPASATRKRSYEWQDPAIAGAAARELSGADFFAAILGGTLPAPPIAATLDFTVVSVQPGRVVFEITPAEFHYNPIGSVHGGMAATLCDSAAGCAVHSMLPAGAYYTSLDLSVKFLRPVTSASGRLSCAGTVIHLGSRTALAQATLTGADGRVYAHATSSCLIFRPGASPRPANDTDVTTGSL